MSASRSLLSFITAAIFIFPHKHSARGHQRYQLTRDQTILISIMRSPLLRSPRTMQLLHEAISNQASAGTQNWINFAPRLFPPWLVVFSALCVFFAAATFWMMIMIILEWTLSIKLNCDEREEEAVVAQRSRVRRSCLARIESRRSNITQYCLSLPSAVENYAPIKNKLFCLHLPSGVLRLFSLRFIHFGCALCLCAIYSMLKIAAPVNKQTTAHPQLPFSVLMKISSVSYGRIMIRMRRGR